MNTLLQTLEHRFNTNMHRHEGVLWQDVLKRIENNSKIKTVLSNMENSFGEPDVLAYDGNLYYVDFSKESPKGRRSLCFDEKALQDRKQYKPNSSVEKEAASIGITLVDELMYYYMQTLEDLDLKTSSWIATPKEIRVLGGALNAEKRYQRTFIFHNGADSYYGSRGFRGYIKL